MERAVVVKECGACGLEFREREPTERGDALEHGTCPRCGNRADVRIVDDPADRAFA